jgi:hypothetical protein
VVIGDGSAEGDGDGESMGEGEGVGVGRETLAEVCVHAARRQIDNIRAVNLRALT